MLPVCTKSSRMADRYFVLPAESAYSWLSASVTLLCPVYMLLWPYCVHPWDLLLILGSFHLYLCFRFYYTSRAYLRYINMYLVESEATPIKFTSIVWPIVLLPTIYHLSSSSTIYHHRLMSHSHPWLVGPVVLVLFSLFIFQSSGHSASSPDTT